MIPPNINYKRRLPIKTKDCELYDNAPSQRRHKQDDFIITKEDACLFEKIKPIEAASNESRTTAQQRLNKVMHDAIANKIEWHLIF